MEKWSGRVALVTGANSGFGEEIARALVIAGMNVVGADINVDVMEQRAKEYGTQPGTFTPMKCDLAKEDDIEDLFKIIKEKLGGIDVCINNAGLCYPSTILEGSLIHWKKMFDVNVIAYCLCSRLSVHSMVERGKTDGQIINICSVAGHLNPVPPQYNLYATSKHAVRFLTEGLRQEIISKKYKIRVAEISPGSARTNVFCNFDEKSLEYVTKNLPLLSAKDIADRVIDILSCPPEVEINEIVVRAQGHI